MISVTTLASRVPQRYGLLAHVATQPLDKAFSKIASSPANACGALGLNAVQKKVGSKGKTSKRGQVVCSLSREEEGEVVEVMAQLKGALGGSAETDAEMSEITPLSSSPSNPANEWLDFNLSKVDLEELRRKEQTDAVAATNAASVEKLGGVSIRRRPPCGPSSHACGDFEFKIEKEGNTPRNILEEIVWHKDFELVRMKELSPLPTLMKAVKGAPPPRDFVGALRKRAEETGVPALIAEVKKASPSRGVIQPDFDPVRIARAYEAGGAACLSVLTDTKFFQGSFENLKLIRDAGVQCPLLCKEFIVDAWQLYYARAKGADAVLLIASVLPNQDIAYMQRIAGSLGMASLVEVHTEEEMARVLSIDGVQMIGINNRDLGTFVVDIGNTERLLAGEAGERIRERNILVVGESGLFTPSDIATVQAAGCSAVLVGESLVKQNDPTAGINGLFGKDITVFSV